MGLPDNGILQANRWPSEHWEQSADWLLRNLVVFCGLGFGGTKPNPELLQRTSEGPFQFLEGRRLRSTVPLSDKLPAVQAAGQGQILLRASHGIPRSLRLPCAGRRSSG